MPIETRSNSALFRRAEQLKKWESSETNNVSETIPVDKKVKIKFSDGCVFLAACAAGDTDEVERMLKQGTDINTTNVDGLTALHQACIDNNFEMVQFLVEHECDVNRSDNEGWTPLHATASCGFISIAKYLMEHGARVAAVNNDGDLPIDVTESTEMEDYLSDVLDAEEIDCDEARAEEERVMLEDAKVMAASTSDLNQKIHPRTGAAPLHVAAAKGYVEVVKVLIQAGVDLNAQDNDGWTPLHASAHWCQKEVCSILADSLANMDIENIAGQTCFDVADPSVVMLLRELKEKQLVLLKERPEIKTILQKTSSKTLLKRRTQAFHATGPERSKSAMKISKAELSQMAKPTSLEENIETECNKTESSQAESTVQLDEGNAMKKPRTESPIKNETEEEKVPSWKKVLRRAAEENNSEPSVSEVTLKRPKKLDDNKDDVVPKEARPVMPIRDEESELQRKAHAKRVRETRRSTQGVLLEDIKSAELQFLINTQQQAAKRQADEAEKVSTVKSAGEVSDALQDTAKADASGDSSQTIEKAKTKPSKTCEKEVKTSDTVSEEVAPSVTLPLKSKAANSPDDTSSTESKNVLGTQAAIQRRKRPKRRSTGVVYLDDCESSEEKRSSASDDLKSPVDSDYTSRRRQKYGSTSTEETPEAVSRTDTSVHSRTKTAASSDDTDYKKLYEDIKKENAALKDTLRKNEDELDKIKKQIEKLTQNGGVKNSVSESWKKERRSLERKVSELEEEMKQITKLKADNERLKEENSALIRVISKISQ